MIKLLILVSVLSVAYSHTCLVFPVQRGGLNNSMSTAGADSCGKIASPCGGMVKTLNDTPILLHSGRNYSIVFQKNLDHYNRNAPGYFQIRIGNSVTNDFETLEVVGDSSNIKTLDFKIVNVTMPDYNEFKGGNLLQLIYHTNNPEAPPNFYQCADIVFTP